MPNYVLATKGGFVIPLEVSVEIDSVGSADFKVNGVAIASLDSEGVLMLSYVLPHRRTEGLQFNDNDEIITR